MNLRILVDAVIFSTPTSPDQGFWSDALTGLVEDFKQDGVFVLYRGSSQSARFRTSHSLFAPDCDYRSGVSEDRRLSALCSELAIDVFMSTQYTSAGANVKSVFVALDSMPGIFQQNPDIRDSGLRAARLATFHAAGSATAAAYVSKFAGVGEEFCRLFKGPRDLISMLPDIYQSAVNPAIDKTNREEEFKTSVEIERLHKSSDEDAALKWQEARRNAGQLPLVPRLWRAVRSVHRYPEYLRRILS
jgi:hypothetical protein